MAKYQSLSLTGGFCRDPSLSCMGKMGWKRDRNKGDKWIHRLGPFIELLYNHRNMFRHPQVV